MEINKERLHFLLQAYVSETISVAELDELTGLMQLRGEDWKINAVVDQVWESLDTQQAPDIDGDAIYSKIMNDPRVRGAGAGPVLRVVKRPSRIAWRIAGVFALLCLATALFLFSDKLMAPSRKAGAENTATAQDITPGGKKAMLTLADGRSISLDDIENGRIAEQSGVLISKTEAGQIIYEAGDRREAAPGSQSYNTIATPRGGEYQLVLPDGTRVWLNAATSLRYPAQFSGDERRVELTGEAYFEVSRQEHLPFIVKTSSQEVEVLGTHFNVRAYQDEADTRTTLVEGKVRVRQAPAPGVTLQPGQQASSSAGSKEIAVKVIDTEEVMAWKNGYFFFQNEDIRSVMNTIARWYDVEIQYQGDMNGKVFAGTISRFESFEKLLETIALTGSVRFEIQGRKVIVIS